MDLAELTAQIKVAFWACDEAYVIYNGYPTCPDVFYFTQRAVDDLGLDDCLTILRELWPLEFRVDGAVGKSTVREHVEAVILDAVMAQIEEGDVLEEGRRRSDRFERMAP
jgi:hypothetical protein